MGIRANALADYRIADVRNQSVVLARLSSSLPALMAVGDYWRAVDPDYTNATDRWTAAYSAAEDYLCFTGPAGFSVVFGARVVKIHGPCRWSGFATMKDLKRVHTDAFRSIARALCSTCIVLIPDYDPVIKIALDNASLQDCMQLLREHWGDPHPITDILSSDEAYFGRTFPPWYVESLDNSP